MLKVSTVRVQRFQSTLPLWGATVLARIRFAASNISIHAPPVGSDNTVRLLRSEIGISIHAPPVGSDRRALPGHLRRSISIHAPPVGSDARAADYFKKPSKFQSTLPLWGATVLPEIRGFFNTISIHAPPVGSDGTSGFPSSLSTDFNPRSPCGERLPPHLHRNSSRVFQSTLPLWGATRGAEPKYLPAPISIHAPPVGSDSPEMTSKAKSL